jgi:hypothetical protein
MFGKDIILLEIIVREHYVFRFESAFQVIVLLYELFLLLHEFGEVLLDRFPYF